MIWNPQPALGSFLQTLLAPGRTNYHCSQTTASVSKTNCLLELNDQAWRSAGLRQFLIGPCFGCILWGMELHSGSTEPLPSAIRHFGGLIFREKNRQNQIIYQLHCGCIMSRWRMKLLDRKSRRPALEEPHLQKEKRSGNILVINAGGKNDIWRLSEWKKSL